MLGVVAACVCYRDEDWVSKHNQRLWKVCTQGFNLIKFQIENYDVKEGKEDDLWDNKKCGKYHLRIVRGHDCDEGECVLF